MGVKFYRAFLRSSERRNVLVTREAGARVNFEARNCDVTLITPSGETRKIRAGDSVSIDMTDADVEIEL